MPGKAPAAAPAAKEAAPQAAADAAPSAGAHQAKQLFGNLWASARANVSGMSGTEDEASKAAQQAKQLFGNLWASAKENVSAVADVATNLADEAAAGGGAKLSRYLDIATNRDDTRKKKLSEGHTGPRPSADAAQYFVEYKGLDLSLLPPQILEAAASAQRS
eukprot:TRINITY_DN46371_c0_g3_i1.p2 TRINITY_DN46371_c0_g3~~TRINITY_DN46371_c0_g3_i1.p2  ORF type:complete len:162 (+),score=57.55 TRINITY_DN46371_c0_g3_i1:94-579(+)